MISFDIVKKLGYTDSEGKPKNIPIWFVEGLAEFAVMQWHKKHINIGKGLYSTGYIAMYKRHVGKGNDAFTVLHEALDETGWSIKPMGYAAAAIFVEYIYKNHGGSKTLMSIWVDTAQHGDIDSAIKRHTQKSVTELKREWRRYLMKEYEFK